MLAEIRQKDLLLSQSFPVGRTLFVKKLRLCLPMQAKNYLMQQKLGRKPEVNTAEQ